MNKIICGDAFDILNKLPNESINLLLTDPPYGANFLSYKPERVNGIKGEKELSENLYIYNRFYLNLLLLAYNKLKIDGSFLLFTADASLYKLLPLVISVGFLKQAVLIWWARDKPIVTSAPRFRWETELILHLTKIEKFKWTSDQINSNVLNVNAVFKGRKEYVGHPTQKPLELGRKLIMPLTEKNDLVVDPFCGSGTFMVAAKELERNYFGCDIEQKYVEITLNRLLKIPNRRLQDFGENKM